MFRQKIGFFLGFFLTALLFSNPAKATLYSLANVKSLAHSAGTACFGTVKDLRQTTLNQKSVSELTFDCEQSAKGNGGVYTFHILNFASAGSKIRFVAPALQPANLFEVGKKYFVFFYNPHPVSGLTSPVGGGQGVFRYDPKVGLVNEYDNQNVFNGLASGSAFKSKDLNEAAQAIQSQQRLGVSVDEMIRLVKAETP
ncbi:MAG: hypothetical protein U1F57_11580 [bacterium]